MGTLQGLLDFLPYTLGYTPSEVALFSPLTEHLGGEHSCCDAEAEREVCLWLWQQLTQFYVPDLQKLVKQWGIAWNSKLYVLVSFLSTL